MSSWLDRIQGAKPGSSLWFFGPCLLRPWLTLVFALVFGAVMTVLRTYYP